MHTLVWFVIGSLAGALLATVVGPVRRFSASLPAFDARPLAEQISQLGQREKNILQALLSRKPVARDLNEVWDQRLTMGQRIADRVATFGGSWTFILLFLAFMAVWMFVNSISQRAFDIYPFILLNLVLSCLAALQAPVIMMSQNRHAAKDRLDAQNDYQVNVKSEMEIAAMHLKLDELRDRQWQELIEIQRRQTELLEAITSQLNDRSR